LHEVSENYSFSLELIRNCLFLTLDRTTSRLILGQRQERVTDINTLINENVFVFVVDETIVVDTHVFVIPQMDQMFGRCNIFGVGGTNTLNYFPDIPQVESVMRLGRSRQ